MLSVKSDVSLSIKELLKNAKKKILQNVNSEMVYTYFEIGRILVEEEQNGKDRAEYGKSILKEVSKNLTKEFGKGFSVQNLERMRKFYQIYSKSSTLLRISDDSKKIIKNKEKIKQNNFTLSWSHYIFLMRLNEKERMFYEKEAEINHWSLRELRRQFDSSLFERVLLSRNKKEVLEKNLKKYHFPEKVEDSLKNPYVLEFLGLKEEDEYTESELEQKIIDHLESFLLELGKGFAFIGRQKRFTFDDQHFFVDLVFYNRLLKCFVIIDLKLGRIKHQDLGQMQMYVNYYDRFIKTKDENPTVGILLSKDKNESLVEITLPENSNIFSKEYLLYLPTKDELKLEIEKL